VTLGAGPSNDRFRHGFRSDYRHSFILPTLVRFVKDSRCEGGAITAGSTPRARSDELRLVDGFDGLA